MSGEPEFDGVREYRAGDRLNLIHQKLSAKSEVIYSKNITFEKAVDALIILNRGDHKLTSDSFEKLVEEFNSKCCELLENHLSFDVINIGYDPIPTYVSNPDEYKKHLINIITDLNTKIYNEYISCYRSFIYPLIINVDPYEEIESKSVAE
jgi:hypothetical protein